MLLFLPAGRCRNVYKHALPKARRVAAIGRVQPRRSTHAASACLTSDEHESGGPLYRPPDGWLTPLARPGVVTHQACADIRQSDAVDIVAPPTF